jgi:membrane protein
MKPFWLALKNSFTNFGNAAIPKKSAALSYYTIFAIAPILYLIMFFLGFFYEGDMVSGEMQGYMTDIMGQDSASKIDSILSNIREEQQKHDNIWSTVLGFGTLAITATGVFVEIQDSINRIWHLKAKPKKGWLNFLTNRLLSFSMIISIGFILLATLLVNTVLDLLMDKLITHFSDMTIYLSVALNYAIVITVVSILFYTIFKILPDGKVASKPARAGAVLTTLLFLIGKAGISIYLGSTNVGSAFGAGGTLILILTWVYYTSMLLFFGALFTREYSTVIKQPIRPKSETVYIVEQEISENPEQK